MKKNLKIYLTFFLAAIVIIVSCKTEKDVTPDDKDALTRYLQLKSQISSFQQNNGNSNLEALGASIMKNQEKKLKSGDASGNSDSSYVDSIYWQNWTCATVTDFIDDLGNNVTVYDYGTEGCEDWGSLIKGKITYTWSQQNNIYYSKVVYENYSAYGMTMNGTSEYSYTFSNMDFTSGDSLFINWSGTSSCKEDIEMVFDDEVYLYTSDYSSEWDNDSYTVHVGSFSCKELNKGYEYRYNITSDLFYNYNCGWGVYVPTRGIEQIILKSETENTSFITDYGDGTCDNIATITENGTSYTIDFGEMWYWPECAEGNCDSVVINYKSFKK